MSEFNNPIIYRKRKGDINDPYIEISETHIVNTDAKVVLTEIPDEISKVKVNGLSRTWYEIQIGSPNESQFSVDYKNKLVTFHSNNIGKQLNFEYKGAGLTYIPTSMIYTQQNNGIVTETLKDLTSETTVARDEANAQGTYAKEQGDHAKTQGDYAKEVGDTAITKWLDPISTFSDISSIYPSPTLGDTVQTLDDGKVYRHNGTGWQFTQGYGATALADINARLGRNERQTQTLDYGANVINGDVNSPATFEIEGKTLTSLGNSNLEDGKSYVLADKSTKVKTFKEDAWKQGVTKFQREQSLTSTADFTGKVSGSVTENPHTMFFGSGATLLTPSDTMSQLNDIYSVNKYSRVSALDSNAASFSATTSGEIAQYRISFNIIEQIERKHGLIPADDLAGKVQWVKDNVNRFKFYWHGYGSGPTGNKATVHLFVGSTWQYPSSHSNGIVTQILRDISTTIIPQMIQADGSIHLLSNAEPSDGVTASTVETDFVSLDVELKSTANLVKTPILSRIATYEGKVSGSTVENPHVVKRTSTQTTLASPSTFTAELSQSGSLGYDNLKQLDGTIVSQPVSTDGVISQMLFSIDIIAEIERKLGKIPASDLSAKVQWAKDNVAKITANWYGYGSSPAGNGANLKVWVPSTPDWAGTTKHVNSIVTKLTRSDSVSATLETNGLIHYLAHAEASDGTTASTINTDYFDCEIELKPTATLWHPSVPLYEVTTAEYDKILVDWNESDVLSRYPSVQGSQHVQNPYVMAEGENLLPPFYEWTLHANATVVSPYELRLDANGVNSSEVYVNIPPNTPLFFSVQTTGSNDPRLDFYWVYADGSLSSVQTNLTTAHTSPSNVKQVRVRTVNGNGASGLATFSQPMLTLGSVAKPFGPRNPSYLYAETKLGSIGEVADRLFYEDGVYKRRKVVEKDVVLDGNAPSSLSVSDYAGFKNITLTEFEGVTTGSGNVVITKHNGRKLAYTSSPVKADGMYTSSNYNAVYITVADADTGWGETYTPTSDDIKRYFNGWKYSNGTTWVSITGNGQTADATTSLSTKPSDYTPYKLSYVLATPKTEVIPHEGAITVNGQTQVEVGSGIVVREKVNVLIGGSYDYINSDADGYRLSNRLAKVINLYRNTEIENNWLPSGLGYGNVRMALPKGVYDPSAKYTVTYIVLDRHLFTSNPADVKAMYSKNLRDAHDSAVKLLEDNATQISIHSSILIDIIARLKAGGL
jgi:hypothetical protein